MRAGGGRRPTVRRQLAAMLALAMAPAGALAVADGIDAYVDARRTAEADFLRATVLSAQGERDALVGAQAALDALGETPTVSALRPTPACDALLARFVESRPGAALATVVNVDGAVVCASMSAAVGRDLSANPGFRGFRDDPRFRLDAVERGAVSGERVLVAIAPVRRDGRIVGQVTLSLKADLAGEFEDAAKVAPADVRYSLVDAAGRPLLRDEADRPPPWLPAAPSWPEELGSSPAIFGAEDRADVDRIYAATPLLDGEVWVVAGAPGREVRAGLLAAAAPSVFAPALMWAIGVAVAYFTIDRLVVRHVVYLSRLARAFGHGRLRLRPRGLERAPAEIGQLGRDLSDMARSLDARQTALAEAAETNRVLLLEVYHRVKNNLQVIASLLSMEIRRAASGHERDTLERIRSRVQSVALVHAALYGGDNVSRVRLDRLTEQILRPLETARARRSGPVSLSLSLDPVEATAERATPFALFLNEAGTNAIAHARSRQGAAAVGVRLRGREDGGFDLVLSNDAAETNEPEAEGLGARLMQGFARQLGGDVEVTREEARHVVRLTAPPGA
jgi:two-component sensor histidine kinase